MAAKGRLPLPSGLSNVARQFAAATVSPRPRAPKAAGKAGGKRPAKRGKR